MTIAAPYQSKTPSLDLPRLRPDQHAIAKHPAKIKLICCGRRWGKTVLCETVALPTANLGAQVAWVVPTYKNSRAIWRLLESVLRPLTKYGVKMRLSEDMVTFPSGGSLSVFSTHTQESADSMRGNAYHLVVMDEGARIAETTYLDVILPTLADYSGDLIIPSTPNGKNWFYNEYMRGLSDMQYQAAFRAPTSDNPSPNIQRAFELARERMPERTFREEWLAEFLDDGGTVFRRIKEAIYAEPMASIVPIAGQRYVAGLDWAQSYDYTVMVVIDVHQKRIVDIDRFNKIDWHTQRTRVKTLYDKWNIVNIYAELNSIGSPNVEALQADGMNVIGMTTTNESKAAWIQSLSLAFERQEIKIPDYPALIGELNAYEMERLPSGRWRYGAPDGMHDDTVMASALGWYGAQDFFSGLMTIEDIPDEFAYPRG